MVAVSDCEYCWIVTIVVVILLLVLFFRRPGAGAGRKRNRRRNRRRRNRNRNRNNQSDDHEEGPRSPESDERDGSDVEEEPTDKAEEAAGDAEKAAGTEAEEEAEDIDAHGFLPAEFLNRGHRKRYRRWGNPNQYEEKSLAEPAAAESPRLSSPAFTDYHVQDEEGTGSCVQAGAAQLEAKVGVQDVPAEIPMLDAEIQDVPAAFPADTPEIRPVAEVGDRIPDVPAAPPRPAYSVSFFTNPDAPWDHFRIPTGEGGYKFAP